MSYLTERAALDETPLTVPPPPVYTLTAARILGLCQDAINLAREFEEVHGYDRDRSAAKALGEVADGLDVESLADVLTPEQLDQVLRSLDALVGSTEGEAAPREMADLVADSEMPL